MIRALILLSVFITTPASAQKVCAVAKQLFPALERSGERKIWEGLSRFGYRIVITSKSETGEFTLFGVYPNGLACFLDGGEAAHLIKPEEPGQGT